uniref:Uncharacterized protein n=1 Tax=Panagrolaimus superbus TaxID=310955 RepID=A0A914YLQ2_9BILA
MSGGFSAYGNPNQSNPYQSSANPFQGGNPFQNNNQFEQKWKNGRWEFTHRKNNPTGQTFTQDDFERVCF